MTAATETAIPVYSRILEAGDTEYAFTSGGIDFFRMVNPDNLPIARYYKAQDYMQELSYIVGFDYLMGLKDALKTALNAGNLFESIKLVLQLESRLKWITNINLLYKYGTCIYFAQDEDATKYDPQRAAKHIEIWQKEVPDAFFLKSQLAQLLPSYEFVKQNLNRYTELQVNQDEIHTQTLLNVLQQLSQNGKMNETISTLQLRAESLRTTLKDLQSSEEKELSNTTEP